MFTKILPSFNYYICSGFGISEQLCRSPSDHYNGTGQGNLLSRESCKVQSCYIIKNIEKKKIGYELLAPIEKKPIDRTVIAFVDDTNFYSNGQQVNENI